MNKRITSIIMIFAMLFSMLATAVLVYAASTEDLIIKAVADKTTVNPGDTVNFTVKLGPHTKLLGLRIQLKLPAGLTFVTGSGKAADNIQTTLNATSAGFTENSLAKIQK